MPGGSTGTGLGNIPYTGTDDASIRAEQGRKMRLTDQQRRRVRNAILLAAGATLVVLGMIVFFWPKPAPTPKPVVLAYQYGVNYPFQYSVQSTSRTNDGNVVTSRSFIFEKGEPFATPTESAGRPIAIRDDSLPVNNFQIVRRTIPRLEIGAYTFDPGGSYDEVRYNMAHTGPQLVKPRITPENKPQASKPGRGR